MSESWLADTRSSYDIDASGYAEQADDSVTGVVAFWSAIHVPDSAVPRVFEEFVRVCRPRAPLLVGFHVGDETEHTSVGYTGRTIAVDSYRRHPAKVFTWLRDAGCTIEGELVMGPDEDIPGAIVFARTPAAPSGDWQGRGNFAAAARAESGVTSGFRCHTSNCRHRVHAEHGKASLCMACRPCKVRLHHAK